jgi:hypothetical protein
VADESDSQDEKHFDPRISTLLGIRLIEAMIHELLQIQFVINVNLIQIQLI